MKTSPHWVRPTLLVVFCLGLLAAIGAVFTQVIAARVPEQRATLEKLITDRTGLAVRFDNVHFAWDMEGTSAVFERVELTDPVRGRVRVVAPELRVEFDTWDFLRHQQFSLGHVTLSSPDIDIIGDPEPDAAIAPTRSNRKADAAPAPQDEAALIRRFTAWAELMPIGRVEVEGARVHLYRRGERAARHNFTLSQAVVSRGSQNFNAFGTLLLSQDIGQSLFVSAKLEGLGAAGAKGPSGELRLIARRVFLDKLPVLVRSAGAKPAATRGRGTVDARLTLRDGRIHEGNGQLSGRELEFGGATHFDHFTVQTRLTRAAGGFALELTDLQVTRGARLERAPRISAQVSVAPGTLQPAGITAESARVPFLAAQFIAAALAAREGAPATFADAAWTVTAGELQDLRYDSRAGTLSAQAVGAELQRAGDHARLSGLAGRVELRGHAATSSGGRAPTSASDAAATFTFDDTPGAQLRLADAEPRALRLAGAFTVRRPGEFDFDAFRVQSDDAVVSIDGGWRADKAARPFTVDLSGVDRQLLGDAWSVLELEPLPQLADLQGGRIVAAHLNLVPGANESGGIDWRKSRGSLELANLASEGADLPRLAGGAGKLDFSQGAARLRLGSGTLEDLALREVRIDWPKRGEPRLWATAEGDLESSLLRRALAEQGLERLAGAVTLQAEARGESAMRTPTSWRVTARIRNASLPLAAGLPPLDKLSGTVRVADGALRGAALEGTWLGGPVNIETRRAGARAVSSAHVDGVADAAPLLELLGEADVGELVAGQVAWNGTLQRREPGEGEEAVWQLSVASNLAGVESRLPAPFAKARARSLPVTAELRFDARGIREFEVVSGRDSVRGRVQRGVTLARFDVQGVSGELRAAPDSSDPRLSLDRLDVQRAPAVLAAAGSLLPVDRELGVHVTELRHAGRALGALDASLARQSDGVEFSLASADGAKHRLDASGRCAADANCRMEFTVSTRELPTLLGDAKLQVEWPTQALRASGELAWNGAERDPLDALTGQFELETQGEDSGHQLMATASLADGQIDLSNVQGSGPAPDQVFRGSGRVRLAARTYDLTVDYEQVSLAASAVPPSARVRLSRALSSLRSTTRRGSPETTPVRRVQWHGSWDGDIPRSPD